MSEIKTNLQQVRVDDPNLQRLLDNLVLALRTWNGETKNELDRVITYRDLIQDTTIASQFNQALYSGLSGGLNVSAGDLTIPAKLSTLIVGQGATKNVVTWSGTGSGNYSYTEVWRNTTDDLGNAVLNGTTEAEVFSDDVGTIAQEYFYWVRAISTGGTPGPFNATAGTAQTVSAVDTAFIADAAIVEAKIASLAVTNAKIASLAVTNAKIANLAVDTAQINTAAITNAKIGNLAVDTLQLANQAVTIPVSAYTSGAINSYAGSSQTTNTVVQSVSIISTGAPIYISSSLTITLVSFSGIGCAFGIKILRGSTIIYQGYLVGVDSNTFFPIDSAYNISETPGTGTYTYTLVVTTYGPSGGNTSVDANVRSLLALETKK